MNGTLNPLELRSGIRQESSNSLAEPWMAGASESAAGAKPGGRSEERFPDGCPNATQAADIKAKKRA
jgi:hypothetical protein